MIGLTLFQLMKKRVKDVKKEKKGVSSIEITIGVMIFLILVGALFDLLILGWKFAVISQTTSNVARITGLQGGVLHSAPDGFPGGSSAYVTASQLKSNIDDIFLKGNIRSNEYQIRINNIPIGQGVQIDYRELINVETTVDYRWSFLSIVLPGNLDSTISSKRTSMSEFKYRYDSWLGE